MSVAASMPESYLEKFREFEGLAAGRDLPWLQKLRSDGFARFCEVGFPSTRDEDWRFTNTSAIARTPFKFAPEILPGLSPRAAEPYQIEGAAAYLVFVNSRFSPELSFSGDRLLEQGVEATSLAAKISTDPSRVEPYLTSYSDLSRDAFSALNTAFWEDGAYVHIPKGVVLEGPICLLFLSIGDGPPFMTHPRNVIVAEENSEAAIVEEYVSLDETRAGAGGGSAALSNTITLVAAGDHSVLSHTMIERENRQSFNVSTLRIEQGRGANVASHSLLLGGRLVRNNVHPVMAGEGGECLINGLFLGTGHQHLDNYMLVEHASPRCASRQFYNGILGGEASGVFHGRIIVHPDAQKTDAKQTNRNLLLSDGTRIDTKPQLEIYADDVKCTHGATIGQLDADALFYLQSRGIDEVSARQILIGAFARECLDRMKPGTVRMHLEGLIDGWISETAAGAPPPGQDGISGNWEEYG